MPDVALAYLDPATLRHRLLWMHGDPARSYSLGPWVDAGYVSTIVPPDHDEYVLVRGDQLVPEDGRYVLQFTEELREVTYLDRLCRKAGIPEGLWRTETTRLSSFEAQVFREDA